MATDNVKFTDISSIPSWKLSEPAPENETKEPMPEGSDLIIEVQVAQLDTVPVGADVTLQCRGKLTMRRVDEGSDKEYRYEIEVMEIAVIKSQKDLMNETEQGA
jgi:hypothetical protein